MNSADVIVVGAGPTGLALACELALAGVRCRVLERRAEEPNLTRAFAVHARTLELLDARGLADEVLLHGHRVDRVAPVPGAALDLGILGTRFPYLMIVPQSGTERVLRARAERLGVDIVRSARVTGFHQDDDGVTLEVAGAASERARYVVGCDGAHSTVRTLAGIPFAGRQYETHILLADVRLTAPPAEPMFARTNPDGAVVCVPFGDGWYRLIAWDRRRENVPLSEPVSRAEMVDAFTHIAGSDLGIGEMRWSTRFLSERRQAGRYRAGRVFLAGDAAHVHSPLGAQGMNTGIGDAMNLGWKLAAAVHGAAAPWLLDTYQAERHPVGARVLAMTDMFNRLVLGRSRVRTAIQALTIRALLRSARARQILAERISGIGIAYPAPSGAGHHRLVGRRMPDVECAGGRLYEQMRDGRFVLLSRGVATDGAPETVHLVSCGGQGPALVLVRPDGHVAWASDKAVPPARLSAAIANWCGVSRPRDADRRPPARAGRPRWRS